MNRISNLKPFITALAVIFLANACSFKNQARKGKGDRYDVYGEREFTADQLNQLRYTTTIFPLRENDLARKEEYEKAIQSAWNFTDIKVIPYTELEDYTGPEYSYFNLFAYNNQVSSFDGNGALKSTANNIHVFLLLQLPSYKETNRRGKVKKQGMNFCSLEMFPDFSTFLDLAFNNTKKSLYSTGTIKNWTPGHLHLYLKDMQHQLENNFRQFTAETVYDEYSLRELRRNTLYVCNYQTERFSMFVGEMGKMKPMEKLSKKYPFNVVAIDKEELSKMILESEEPVYVLDYVRANNTKIVRVYNSKAGKIYQRGKALSLNLKPKDLKKITRKL